MIDSGRFLWIALTAAVLCLVSLIIVMVFIRWATTNFEQEVATTFALLHQSLSLALTLSFSPGPTSITDREDYRALHQQLLTICIKLNESYSQAAFEFRVGRLSCT